MQTMNQMRAMIETSSMYFRCNIEREKTTQNKSMRFLKGVKMNDEFHEGQPPQILIRASSYFCIEKKIAKIFAFQSIDF